MAHLDNIELFNRICIALFDRLYSAFPVPIEIDANDLANAVIPENASFDETWDTDDVSREVMSFLHKEGFLTYETSLPLAAQFSQVRLTMKGLAVLGYVPDALEAKETPEPLIAKIRGIIAGGLKDATGKAIGLVVSKVFSLVLTGAP